jgi:hypothetical protein
MRRHIGKIMKLNILDTHERHKHLMKNQWEVVAKGAEDCLKNNPIAVAIQMRCPYVYLYAHPRTADNGADKRLLWQPRISRPPPQTNSFLFRAISKTDLIEICWLLPPREMWRQYEKGKVTESDLTAWSIDQFQHNREVLARDHPEDLSDEAGCKIYREIMKSMTYKML